MRAWLWAVLLVAGCGQRPGGGSGCVDSADCAGGQTCTRPSVCSAQPGAVTVRWTVDGVTPTLAEPGGCATLGDLRIEVVFHGAVTQLVYAPVPCAVGASRIDRLPLDTLSQIVLKRSSQSGEVLVAQPTNFTPRDDGGDLSELQVVMPLRTR